MITDSNMVTHYCGRPIEEMDRDELLEVIWRLSRDLTEARKQSDHYRKYVDWRLYNEDDT